jgi:hypothetical protein
MPRILVGCLAILAIAAVGCASAKWQEAGFAYNRADSASAAEAPAAKAPGGAAEKTILQAPAAGPVAAIDPRQVIYSAALSVVVADVAAAVEKTRTLAEGMGGYADRVTNSKITFRVPAPRFNEALAAIAGLGTVTEREVKAQDVTEEYQDLSLRLKSAKALHEKLLELLGKAATVKDSLEVEREVARVRTEIETLEGQINRLSSQINFSTIAVDFAASKEAPAEMRLTLPFRWLNSLGVENLLDILRR